MAHVEPWVVGDRGAGPRQDGARPATPGMAVAARGLAGDPLAAAAVERSAAVEGRRQLATHPRRAAAHAREESDVQVACLSGHVAVGDLHGNPGIAQALHAGAGHQRIGIDGGDHDATQSGGDQRVAARWRASMVRAGLERHPRRAATRRGTGCLRGVQRHHLGVRLACALRGAFADDVPRSVGEHAADPRIRVGAADGGVGQLQRALQLAQVVLVDRHLDVQSTLARSVRRRLVLQGVAVDEIAVGRVGRHVGRAVLAPSG